MLSASYLLPFHAVDRAFPLLIRSVDKTNQLRGRSAPVNDAISIDHDDIPFRDGKITTADIGMDARQRQFRQAGFTLFSAKLKQHSFAAVI